MIQKVLLLMLVLMLVLVPVRVGATVLVPAEMSELAQEAGAIVRGVVSAAVPRWSEDRRSIVTVVTLDAEESLKGSLGDRVQFVVPGGVLGRYRNIVVGAPEFAVGQHVVVFLGWHGPSYPYLLGLGQGVYRVEQDRVRGHAPGAPTSLALFEQRVREFAGTAR